MGNWIIHSNDLLKNANSFSNETQLCAATALLHIFFETIFVGILTAFCSQCVDSQGVFCLVFATWMTSHTSLKQHHTPLLDITMVSSVHILYEGNRSDFIMCKTTVWTISPKDPIWKTSVSKVLEQWCQTQFLEGRSPAEFSFNPN